MGNDPAHSSERPDAETRLGTTLRGKWRLDTLLGTGGMAAVYAATHRNGMRGAVKLLHPIHCQNDSVRERFLREGYIANKVGHIGAVRVLDDDTTEDGGVFLVMELLEGEALIDRVGQLGGHLAVEEVLWLANQLLDTLAAAHARGVIHRDVKPDNLFLTTDGVLKVLDFGLARLFDEEEMSRTTTQTGVVMGTPAYMSPEQARGRWNLVDAQSDLWSVGATLFALLSGEHVHAQEETPSEMLAATFTKPARSLASVLPGVHPAVTTVVDRALALKKTDRYACARDMQAAVREAYLDVTGQPLPPIPSLAYDSQPPTRFSAPEALFSFTKSRSSLPMSARTTLAPPITTTPAERTVSDESKRRRVMPWTLGAIAAAVLLLTGGIVVRSKPTASPPAGAALGAKASLESPANLTIGTPAIEVAAPQAVAVTTASSLPLKSTPVGSRVMPVHLSPSPTLPAAKLNPAASVTPKPRETEPAPKANVYDRRY